MSETYSLAVTRKELLEAVGPAPNIKATAQYLRENEMKTYRRIVEGTLERLPGKGSIRVSIPSLLRYLNGGELHAIDPGKASRRLGKTGKRKPKSQPTAQTQVGQSQSEAAMR